VPLLTEILLDAHFKGGDFLRDARDVVSPLDMLDGEGAVAREAGRLVAEFLPRGRGPERAQSMIRISLKRETSLARRPIGLPLVEWTPRGLVN